MRAHTIAAVLGAISFSTAVHAQQATFQDSLLDHLTGKWVLTGKIGGKPTTHDVSAAWVLNHQYVELQEVSREKNKKGEPYYTAHVYIGWDQPTAQYVCVWLDDYGDISTQSLGHARRAGDSIAFVFRDTGDPGKFHTTFAYDVRRDGWTMNMDNESNGKLSPFARTVLTRAK
jgi:hypothetical protein